MHSMNTPLGLSGDYLHFEVPLDGSYWNQFSSPDFDPATAGSVGKMHTRTQRGGANNPRMTPSPPPAHKHTHKYN